MEFFSVVTVEAPELGVSATLHAVLTIRGEVTRQGIYEHMRAQVVDNYGPQFEHAKLVFFSAEPNTFTVS